jgi:hypothetical protein
MKRTKLLGTTLAAFAALALVGLSSAQAMELCDKAAEVCAAEDVIAEGTELMAESSKATITSSLGSIVCTEAGLTVETGAVAGSPLPGHVSKLTFAGCTLGETGCTITAPVQTYYTLSEETGGDAASLEIRDGGEGQPSASIKCGAMSCTASTEELALAVKGGEPATFNASEEALKVEGGFPCPKTASLTATYSVSSPAEMHINGTGTKLCEEPPQGGTCPDGKEYKGGISATLLASTKAKFDAAQFVECTEAPLTGTGFKSDGRDGSLQMSFTQTGGPCNASGYLGASVAGVTVENQPFARSSFNYAQAGAYLTLASNQNAMIKFKIESGSPFTCKYELVRFSWLVTGYNPMKIESLVILRKVGAGSCPGQLPLGGKWSVTRTGGGNLWVTQ